LALSVSSPRTRPYLWSSPKRSPARRHVRKNQGSQIHYRECKK
jgi:hypothetical protein